MADSGLKAAPSDESVPHWRVPKVLLNAAVRSSTLLGHDLINRYRAERFQLFVGGHLALWAGFGGVLPLLEYVWILRSYWYLILAAIGITHCFALSFALRLAQHKRYEDSITLMCVATWITTSLVTFVSPPLLPAMALIALVPVVFAEPYVRWQRGLAFTVLTAGCLLAMTALARFTQISDAVAQTPRWVETTFIVVAVPLNAFHLLVIVWNNAAALRTFQMRLAERAAELAASRTRLIAAADEERRRLERDLHDGAQQHLVALSVLIGLARSAEHGEDRSLLAEASELLNVSIAEIRRLAHGIYPPLLVSGGLSEALPTLGAHAAVPVRFDIRGLDRYPAPTEAALYYCCSEALQNAAKHGGPDTTVTVTARADDRVITLVISDTGRGFESAAIGMGLTNMRDRLSAIGGTLSIDTAPGRGTRIIATAGTSD
ncbi:ATP-binding protein [Mycolicibacterium sp. ND9-15]|uniref:sensor histidine kinase n=1 Tax=Mycolicibacterium sp. ND9-15 TaxID=3042320 RepID=UPI002DDB8D1A|nr:ATP-binding protein [Mycolicibacterium sp. ND9-15]WSE54737.1 ATP-binding protein [Mycolicibacterium sp. ND9-15]